PRRRCLRPGPAGPPTGRNLPRARRPVRPPQAPPHGGRLHPRRRPLDPGWAPPRRHATRTAPPRAHRRRQTRPDTQTRDRNELTMAVPQKLVAVVVPASDRAELTADEEISLRHLLHFLGDYDRYLVLPR